MDRDDLTHLYDDEYADSYEEKFLLSPLTRSDAEYELELLRQFLASDGSWLDVGCGTGFFLRHFPAIDRAGIDISPAMLRRARESNPRIPLTVHDFREPLPSYDNRWNLVSCMWYAYGLVNTVDEVLNVIHNLWSWTSPGGTCFVPLADPVLITGAQFPYRTAGSFSPTSTVVVTGIIWSYLEDDGKKVHSHQIAPSLEFMTEQFEIYFREVEIVRYPPTFPGWDGRPALVARGKRSIPPGGSG